MKIDKLQEFIRSQIVEYGPDAEIKEIVVSDDMYYDLYYEFTKYIESQRKFDSSYKDRVKPRDHIQFRSSYQENPVIISKTESKLQNEFNAEEFLYNENYKEEFNNPYLHQSLRALQNAPKEAHKEILAKVLVQVSKGQNEFRKAYEKALESQTLLGLSKILTSVINEK